MTRALVLFDIDGTLIRRAGPHHRQALVEAVRSVTGIESTTDDIPVQGMLDRDILSVMLQAAGASQARIKAWMPALMRRAQWIYARSCPDDLRDKVCPGIPALLKALDNRGAVMGLVTGNLKGIAWKKMQRARLRRFFRFGAFSGQAKTRADLCRQAVSHSRLYGCGRRTLVTLVGDHPNDVLAARANGVRSVAVATGLASRDELAALNPDVIADNLEALGVETFFP